MLGILGRVLGSEGRYTAKFVWAYGNGLQCPISQSVLRKWCSRVLRMDGSKDGRRTCVPGHRELYKPITVSPFRRAEFHLSESCVNADVLSPVPHHAAAGNSTPILPHNEVPGRSVHGRVEVLTVTRQSLISGELAN